jgi:GAF domain-containing protein
VKGIPYVASSTCSNCGNQISSDALGGLCPSCAMQLALSQDLDDSSAQEVSIPDGLRNTVKEQLSSELKTRRFIVRFRWLVLVLLVLALCYTGSRLIWAQQHFRPNIIFDDSLHVIFNTEHYGLTRAHTLESINEIPISAKREMSGAFDAGPKNGAQLVFSVDGDDVREIEWILTPDFAAFEIRRGAAGVLQADFGTNPFELAEGERVLTINDIPLEELLGDEGAIEDAKGDENFVTRLEIQTPTGTRQIILDHFSFETFWVRLAIAFGFGIIGMLVFWLRPDTRSGTGFLIFAGYAALFWMARALPLQYRHPVENYGYYSLQCFLPLASAVFIFTFTPMRLLKRSKRIGYMVVTIFCVALFVGNILFEGHFARLGLLSTGLFRIWALALLVMLLLSLPGDWWLRIRGWKLSPTDIQRAWVLRIALLCAFLPAALYTSTYHNWDRTENFAVLFDLSVLLFPLLIGYAILRRNLLQLNELALESLTYLVLLVGIVTAYIVGTTALLPLLTAVVPADSDWPRPVMLAGILALATPLHQLTRRKLDERYSRTPFEFERFLHETESHDKATTTPFEYAFTVLHQISSLFRVENTALFLRFPGQDTWTLSAVLPAPETGQPMEDCSTLLAILEEDRKSISKEEILENVRYRFVQDEALKGMSTLHASIVFPLISRERLIGALCLGEKAFHKNYSRKELALLKRIAVHVSSSLFNLMGRIMALEGRRIVDIFPNYPERIGGYAIKSVIGEGGMSYVYLGARDRNYYAIKVPSRMVQSSSALLERFQREMLAVQRLDHPNIIHAQELAWEGSEPYIVFDYYPSGSLSDELKDKGPFPQKEVVSIARQVVDGLAAAFDAGIIHRDIKPSNLFQTRDGVVKIADFGLAKLADVSSLTLPGQVFGTPSYVAPELIDGMEASILSDQYALGISLVELLTGIKPFQGESIGAVLKRVAKEKSSLLQEVERLVDAAFAEIITRLLSPSPKDRYASHEEFQEALRALEESRGDVRN